MNRGRTILALVVLAIVAVGSFSAYEVLFMGSSRNPCATVSQGGFVTSQTSQATIGAITEYSLPSPDRWPNAVTVANDGSVWFAEQGVPGVGHLFPNNGTVVEYAWSGYTSPRPPDCIPSVSSSGIAFWNGRVWVADEFGNAIIGLNPRDGSTVAVNVTGKASFPYWLSAGPDGALWFTSDNSPARLGIVQPDLSVRVVDLQGLGSYQPIQLDFVNSSLAFLSTINQAMNLTTHACECDGHIYSFDPRSNLSSSTALSVVGGNHRLLLPTGVSYSGGAIWVTQHLSSSIERYTFATKTWTTFPTSIESWDQTSLPLVVKSTGNQVWFNEHYANKIALLDPRAGTLTEYSESDPPASNFTQVQNDLSIAESQYGLWFTSMSGNYIGFVDPNFDPGYKLSASGPTNATVAPGGNGSFSLKITGSWNSALKVNASDSETTTSVPKGISIIPGTSSVPAGSQPYALTVDVRVTSSVVPGNYVVAVTLGDGVTQESLYLTIDVA